MRRFTRTLSHTDVGALDYVVLFKFKKCGRRIEPDDALLKGQACDRYGSMRTAILGWLHSGGILHTDRFEKKP